MDQHTNHAAHRGDELYGELMARIRGETADLGDMVVTLGTDTATGFPALRIQAGDTLFALIADGGELTELRGNVGNDPED